MSEFPRITTFDKWHLVGNEVLKQQKYVADEIRRIHAEGAPVITHILNAPSEQQITLGLRLLHYGDPETGQPIIEGFVPRLRIVPGALPFKDPSPFLKDAQGRELPEAKRGNFLRAKVGTLGGRIIDVRHQPGSVVDRYDVGPLTRAEMLGEPIYAYVEIGKDPVSVSISDAAVILRTYGYGMTPKRFRTFLKNGQSTPVQADWWIVEEVPFGWAPSNKSKKE